MSRCDPPYTPRARRSRTTEQVVWRFEDTADGCVALRAVPWWHPRAYLNFAVIVSAIIAIVFAGMWWFGITTSPIPWWWVAIAVVFGAYWPIDRAFVQDRARPRFPIVLRPSTGEIGIDGERFAMKVVEAVECVDVRYGPKGDEYTFVCHELHAIIAADGPRRRIVIVEGMNSRKIAAELARMIGCAVRIVEAVGSESRN